MHQEGTILRIDGKTCIVHSDQKEYRAYIKKRIKGAVENQLKPVCVGDKVLLEVRKEDEVLIHEVLPRKTWLARKAVDHFEKEQVIVANVEQLFVVASFSEPPFNSGIIDRFLLAASKGNLIPGVIINKSDLKEKEEEEIHTKIEIYKKLGYEVLLTSIYSRESIENLRKKLQGKSTVLVGHSGVGKSSLLVSLDSSLEVFVQSVNAKTFRGRHTTTTVTLWPLPFGGFLVDTPGIREFALWQMDAREVSLYFPEMKSLLPFCKYKSCTHTHEPDCAVKLALEKQEIALFRYQSYCRILESLQGGQENF